MMISTTIRICPSRCLLLLLLAKMLYVNAYYYLWLHKGGFGRPIQCGCFGLTIFSLPWVFYQPPGDFYTWPPTGDSEKYFKPRMVCDLCDCAVSPQLCLLCAPCDCVPRWLTLPTLSYSVPPYPLYDHISLHHLLCVWPETGGGKGNLGQDQAQITTLVMIGNVW